MKFFFVVPVVFFFSLISIHSNAQADKEIGHLEFSDTLFNFGSVREDQGVLSHTFSFVNLGPEHFFIEDIDPSCGCITPEYPLDTIHPGEQRKVTLYFDPVNHPGVFERKVTIKGNASKAPVYLYIRGYVTPSPQPLKEWERTSSFKYETIYLQRNYLNYGTITTKEPVQMEISVYNSGTHAITLTADKLKLPSYLKVSLLPVKIEPKEKGMIKVSFNPKATNKYGHFAEQVELTFQSSAKSITVPLVVSAFIKEYFTPAESISMNSGKISLDKTEIDLGTVKTDEKIKTEVSLINTGMADLNIKAIRISCSCIEAYSEKTILKPGASTKITIVFDTTERLGQESKFLTIFTNDPMNPIATIRMRANVVEGMIVTPGQ